MRIARVARERKNEQSCSLQNASRRHRELRRRKESSFFPILSCLLACSVIAVQSYRSTTNCGERKPLLLLLSNNNNHPCITLFWWLIAQESILGICDFDTVESYPTTFPRQVYSTSYHISRRLSHNTHCEKQLHTFN